MIDFKFDLQRFDSAFSGGSGTQNDPYRISSQADLEQLARDVNGREFESGNSYSGKYFKVTNDIALTGTWTTIGSRTEVSFHGNFDGGGHTISNLTITRGEGFSYASGFFGYVYDATISNLNLTNVNIDSNSVNVGALVGDTDGSAGKDSHIFNCSVQGVVNGTGGNSGGFVGSNYAFIRNCAFIGTVKKAGGHVGIIAGSNAASGFIYSNYYCGDPGDINTNGATRIFNVDAPDNVNFDGDSVTFGGKKYIKGGEVTFNYNGVNYRYTVNNDVTVTIKDNKFYVNNTDLGAVFPTNLDGDGSEKNPFLIKNEENLRQLTAYVNNGNNCAGMNFKLANDIKLNGNWTPIGNSSSRSFKGTFDGNGKTVSGLTITDGDRYQGLFGYVQNATIKDVNLTGVNITAKDSAGSLVGYAADNTQISNCSAQGTVKATGANSYSGGLVGLNSKSTIKNSAFLSGSITGNKVGAIAGRNDGGTFTDNYYSGDLKYNDSNGATRIFNVSLPDSVSLSGDSVTFGGKKYIKGGEVTFNYNGVNYKYTVNDDVTVTIKDNKLYVNNTDLGAVFPATLDGDGSEKNPFLIKTEDHLRQFTTYVNNGNTCKDMYFKLANDIALTGEWEPIGDNVHRSFRGTFDGDGKTISNLTTSSAKMGHKGLFCYIEDATIKNVNLTNVNISGQNSVGSLVGYVRGKSQISNCSASGTLKSTVACSFIGGLVGHINAGDSTIDGCTFSGDIKGFEFPKFPFLGSYGGGLVGVNDGATIKNSAFLGGSITGNNTGVITAMCRLSGTLGDNYYCGKLSEGVEDNGAKQIFNVTLPEGVTSTALVEINGKRYIKGGDATFTYNGNTYNHTVNNDISVTIQDNKLSFDNAEVKSARKLTMIASEDYLLWGNADTSIYKGSNDVIYGFGKEDSPKANDLDDIVDTYNAERDRTKISGGTDLFALKDFMTKAFAVNNGTLTPSGNTISKRQ